MERLNLQALERQKTLATLVELKNNQRVLEKKRLEVRRVLLLEEKLKATQTTSVQHSSALDTALLASESSDVKTAALASFSSMALNKKSFALVEAKLIIKNKFNKETSETLDSLSKITAASLKFPKPGIVVKVEDLLTNTTTLYPSIRKACEAMGTTIGSIHRRNNLQIAKGIHTPYRKRYLITFLKS